MNVPSRATRPRGVMREPRQVEFGIASASPGLVGHFTGRVLTLFPSEG